MKETVRDLLSFRGRELELVTISQYQLVSEAIEKMTSPNLEGVKTVGALLVTRTMKDPTDVGILTERDIVEKLFARLRQPDLYRVKAIMTRDPTTIDCDDPITKAQRIMIQGNFGHLPVTENGIVITIISEHDLLRAIDYFQEVEIDNQLERVHLFRH